MPKLGVNIDHVATLRQARGEFDPDPILAVKLCEKAGADSIVCHLREDRRHINDLDIRRVRKIVKIRMNLELSLNKEIVQIAIRIKPDQGTLVPERRQEITTEGGLDVVRHFKRVKTVAGQLSRAGIIVSLFIDPVKKQIDYSIKTGVKMIEFHTGKYATAKSKNIQEKELNNLRVMTRYALQRGLTVNAGHGLKYHNTRPVARIPGIEELNIGHSIISKAVFVGLTEAVKQMKKLCKG